MSFTSIPILDLAQSRDPATKPQFLAELRHVLMEVGFLYLKNVGIPDDLWREVISEGRAFFDIPREEKYVDQVSEKACTSRNGARHFHFHLVTFRSVFTNKENKTNLDSRSR